MPPSPTGLDLAAQRLRRSIPEGRPMSWPNFRRLAARLSDPAPPPDPAATVAAFRAARPHRTARPPRRGTTR